MSGVSNHYDTMSAIKTVIDGLSLSGLTGGTVIQEVAEYQDGDRTLPFVSISPWDEKVDDELNDRDGIYYGVLVAIIGAKGAITLETRLGWRQSMRRHLNNASIASLGMNYNLKVEPREVVHSKAYFDRKVFVSGFVIRAFFQEPRS